MPERSLAVIPARGGSKRVPMKNVRSLRGTPAIVYTIRAALESGLFEKVVVSTDSETIAAIAREAGAEIPFLRGSDLSGDYVAVSDVTLDALVRLDPNETAFTSVCQLMANCPLRNAGDIQASFRQFSDSGADAQISVTGYGWLNPWWAVRMGSDFRLTHLLPEALGRRSQDLPEVFCPTGAVWWAKSSVLRKERNFHIPNKTGWEIPWPRGIDIDSEDDWRMAEILLEHSGSLGKV